jgi:hypothetical protein
MKYLATISFLAFFCFNLPAKAADSAAGLLRNLTIVRINPCTTGWSLVKSEYGYSYGCSSPGYSFYVPDAYSLVDILKAQEAKLAELEARIQKLEAPK